MNHLLKSTDLDGYSHKVRVNYHVIKPKSGVKSATSSTVKFASQHKSYPGLQAIISVSIDAEANDQPNILKIESLQVIDSKEELSGLSDDVLQQILSSILLATFEYGNSHSINEWLIPVKPEFDEDLTEIGLPHNRYSFDDKGRCIIGVRPSEFLSKGKQLIDSWTRRLFESEPLLN